MTDDLEQLERELALHMAATAEAPRADAAARVRARLAAMPQRRAWLVRLGDAARSPGWARAGALAAVAAAALLLGIYIGQVGLPIQIGPSPSGSVVADPSPSKSDRPAPSGDASIPPAVAMSYALWQRFEMPDPAPGVYGGGTPRALVEFNGGYVAVGTRINNCCAGEPSENDGVVWTSTDGRAWELVDTGATFTHASLHQVVVAGSRLLATGWYAAPGDERQVAAAWASVDGVAWERIPDPAPSWVVVADGILLGAADVTSSSGPPVGFLRSDDGLAWTVTDVQPEMDWVSAVAAAPGGGALFVGHVEGARLPDGSPTSDVQAWTTADGITWTGVIAAENAVFKSVAPWADGFVAVGSQPRVVEGTEVDAGVIWTSPDGLSWNAEGTGSGIEESTMTGVFRAGEALVAVAECCGGDLVLRPTAWVSEDGVDWIAVPHQASFSGSGIVVAGIVTSDLGLVAIGQRWDSGSNHPLPQAWVASSEPMVWLLPSSEGGAAVGEERPFEMGHCGLTSPIDFDGSLWAPEGDPLALPFDMTSGTISLVAPDRAHFVTDGGTEVFLARLDGGAAYPLCD